MKAIMKAIALFGMLLTMVGLTLAGPQSQQAQQAQQSEPASVIAEPSLGEIARAARERRAKENTKDVPLYTNDDLPTTGEGLSIVGPSRGSQSESVVRSARANLLNEQMMTYLRGKLGRLQHQQQLHQRELSVLEQQISQTKMEWSPNPNETLRQEYSRQNVRDLASEIDQKKQELTDEQSEIQSLQDQLQRAQAKFGWLSEAAPAAQENNSGSLLPPGIKPGTPEYWNARIEAARQQLATAKEQQSLAKNELSLLKLQQLRSLNPNVQANLASSIPQKEAELAAAAQAVTQAEENLQKVQKEAQTAASQAQ